jgi:hypothetical protein
MFAIRVLLVQAGILLPVKLSNLAVLKTVRSKHVMSVANHRQRLSGESLI